jgi:hypothetical protein
VFVHPCQSERSDRLVVGDQHIVHTANYIYVIFRVVSHNRVGHRDERHGKHAQFSRLISHIFQRPASIVEKARWVPVDRDDIDELFVVARVFVVFV